MRPRRHTDGSGNPTPTTTCQYIPSPEVEGTEIAATTIHGLFDFDGNYQTKLDFSKPENKQVATLLQLKLLMLDEVLWFIL